MTEQRIVAVDIDLRRVHAWDAASGRVCYNAPTDLPVRKHAAAYAEVKLLVEIAGPVMHREGDQRRLHHTHRWMLFNAATVAALDEWVAGSNEEFGTHIEMVVATSTAWTRGHSENVRREFACADATNHDLRECQAMIAYYRAHPKPWVPLATFLEQL